ncbi:AAA family ATPase [Cellvibrio fontiphilus]|uniref:AAA family ATPase n=1 Tax=Cellvibrio fontiphilus TaxID=1815559 RepID=A0ABV7FBA0_9GAMM
MKIINKISVKYFRSLHTVEIKDCSSINVISGRNDVGKSNVIKALNLFFNGQADWDSDYSFYDNFSKKRLEEVRKDSIKGKQFVSIKIEFSRPENYHKSLPETFNVERKWFRDSKTFEQSDDLSALDKAKKLPSKLTTAQRALGRFLNKIHFEYVPAIKDRIYFNDLLRRLQFSLLDLTISQNQQLFETANTLADHIEGQITDLKMDFEKATNIHTTIQPPSTVSSLFQAFFISTQTDSGEVALKFRGDGLQSRYIASVLHYIASNSNDYYIWGYEEPELALEYSHASKMADDFSETYSKRSQIFLTSHSPAFISLAGENVSCYRATQENAITDVSNVLNSNNKELLRYEIGILDIQKEVHELYSKEFLKLKSVYEKIDQLELEINRTKMPMLVTEGKTDKIIIEKALEIFGENAPSILVRACDNSGGIGSSGGAGQLGRLIETIHPDDDRIVIALFDNDEEGQKEFSGLSKNFTEYNKNVKRHRNGIAWAIKIPEPDFREGYADAKNLCIEYLFDDGIISKKNERGEGLKFRKQPPKVTIGNVQLSLNLDHLDLQLKKYEKIETGKDIFSQEIINDLNLNDFRGFKELFNEIKEILQFI